MATGTPTTDHGRYLEELEGEEGAAVGAAGAGVEEEPELEESVFELPESDFEVSLFASVFVSAGLLELPFA